MIDKIINKKTIPTIDKTTNKMIWIGGTVIILIGAGVTIWYVRKKKKEQIAFETPEDSPAPVIPASLTKRKIATTPRFKCASRSYPLNYGTCHPDVEVLQKYLVSSFKEDLGRSGRNKDGTDGMIGNKTKQAAKRRLGKESFTSSDIVGMKSALKLVGR